MEEWIAWTSGKLKLDWIGLESTIGVPIPLMYCLLGGLGTIMYLPDPANPTVMESNVENPNKFTKDFVMTKISIFTSGFTIHHGCDQDIRLIFETTPIKLWFSTSPQDPEVSIE